MSYENEQTVNINGNGLIKDVFPPVKAIRKKPNLKTSYPRPIWTFLTKLHKPKKN